VPLGRRKFALDGLFLAVAKEVGQFGIKMTVVEPGFFRTNLLDAQNVRWGKTTIEDYSAEGSAQRCGRLLECAIR
jgi:NAD(P)-dependent dehydrogenase (short-subunit alcohol dehydrogenase family)